MEEEAQAFEVSPGAALVSGQETGGMEPALWASPLAMDLPKGPQIMVPGLCFLHPGLLTDGQRWD